MSSSTKIGISTKSRIPVRVKNPALLKKENIKKATLLPPRKDVNLLKKNSDNNTKYSTKSEEIVQINITNSKLLNNKKINVNPLQNGKLYTKSEQNKGGRAQISSNILKKETTNFPAKNKLPKKDLPETKKNNTKQLKNYENNIINRQKDLNDRKIQTAVVSKAERTIQQTSLKVVPKIPEKNNKNILDKETKLHKDGTKDDLKSLSKHSEKENKLPSKPSYILDQKDIKFEAKEIFRKMLLSERALSPSMFRPGQKLSLISCDRPSIYKTPKIPSDPLKELQDACLSLKRDKKSSFMQAAVNRAIQSSPIQDRYSFYTPDPKKEVMRSLEALKAKKLLKSTKKVSFNLNNEEYSEKEKLNCHQTPYKHSECHLTNITERSEENTPNSPVGKLNETTSAKQDENDMQTSNKEEEKCVTDPEQISAPENELKHDFVDKPTLEMHKTTILGTPMTKSAPIPSDMRRESIAADFVSTTKEITDTIFQSLRKLDLNFSPASKGSDKVTEAKLYTPRPISFFTKSSLVDISSPDFLADADNKLLADFAPISTPFVLRSLAKSSVLSPEKTDLSPVRLKLDFTDEGKDSPQKEVPTKTYTSLPFDQIATYQKILDDLADKECNLWLINESIPVVCGRYLRNPVAMTLAEGDDMHFIPIGF